MQMRRRLIVLSLAALIGAGGMAKKPQSSPTIRCSASGAKLFTPPMTDDEACAHFLRALQAKGHLHARSAAGAAESVTVALRFKPNGVATAVVTQNLSGAAQPPTDFNVAVSDRGFRATDIDSLASDVAAGLNIQRR